MAVSFDPQIAIIIPVFKHSVFISEAIDAAIDQVSPYPIATVIVDDGCPFPETSIVGASYALARNDVFYLRKPNGGLSSARNFGIDFAIENFPNIAAVYFLDADNRITPNAIAGAFAILKQHPGVDWVYPNIDKFGAVENVNLTPPYSPLLHIVFDNICEAGSLVSRRMIDAGCRFDEAMRAGMEDWDFWLQGLGKGMRGINAPFFGFEYRMRGESMLSNTDREREAVLHYLQKKHKSLFASRTLLEFEHEQAPRYAQIDTATSNVRCFVDPARESRDQTFDELIDLLAAATLEPDHYGAPDLLLWLPQAAMAEMIDVGLASTVLRALEISADRFHFIAVRMLKSHGRFSLSLQEINPSHPLAAGAQGWVAKQSLFRDCVADTSTEWMDSLKYRVPAPRVAELTVEAPFPSLYAAYPSVDATAAMLANLRDAKRREHFKRPAKRWNWRQPYLPAVSERYRAVRQRLRAGAVNPHCYHSERLQIGVALPIASFGGVEKVAFALARVLADENCDLHLFGFGKPEVLLQEGQSYPFKTTNFLFDANYALWGGLRRYMGHELRIEHEDAAKTEDVVGLLLGLDVLICAQVAPLNAAIGRLRREGVKIVNHLHVIDETPQCRSVGHPYLALGFEHAYDAILTCSETLKAWLHGMGAPDEKLLVVHNAPGYAIDERRLANLLSLRTTPSAGSPLRAVFLGRLDEQKGVDRLILAVKAARQARLDIHWRVVGSAILSDGESDSWAEQLSNLGVRIEPPIFDSDQLSKIYLESDILLLPSRWEGAPLSIIEAQRLGCVPIATDVGAVNELIDDGVDGFLLPRSDDEKIALVLVSRLEELGQDREKLALISSRAIRRGAAPVWAKNVQPLIDVLRQWFPGRSFSDGAGRA